MKKNHPVGSRQWLDYVFLAPPARDPQGRSRPTQRYLAQGDDGTVTVAEGGNTATARSLLATMKNAGMVKRWKLEPFALNGVDHGVNATPDILFETTDGRAFVVETKASKYLTDEKQQKQRRVESVITQSGMTFLLWTDRWPLSAVLWRHLREMRRLGSCDIPYDRLFAVAQQVAAGPKTLTELRQVGLYRHHVLAAVWAGQAHFDLFRPLEDKTPITSNPKDRRFETTLHAPVEAYGWWRTLEETV